MRTHKDLEVWKLAMRFVSLIYKATNSFPSSEIYGLTNQLRRSAVSIPSNIAEGAARQTDKEFVQFLYIARGSLMEVDTQLLIAVELKFLEEEDFEELIK